MDKLRLFENIYRQYSGRMLAICMRYCTDKSLAKDLMHDGFIHIYNSLDRFEDRGEGSMRAWMERVMVNHCLQDLRKKDVFKNSVNIDDSMEYEIGQDVEEALVESVKQIPQEVLQRFIMELPVGYRTVFNMYVMENMSHKEIAKALSINEKSSSSQLSRAKVLLVKKLNEYERNKR
jgi:RNA polymerase sigma-70 factor, ECF subfamily